MAFSSLGVLQTMRISSTELWMTMAHTLCHSPKHYAGFEGPALGCDASLRTAETQRGPCGGSRESCGKAIRCGGRFEG